MCRCAQVSQFRYPQASLPNPMLTALCSLVLMVPHGAAYPPLPPLTLPPGVPGAGMDPPLPGALGGGAVPGPGSPTGGGSARTPGAGGGVFSPGAGPAGMPGGGAGGFDPGSWKHWWHYRGPGYLNLRRRVRANVTLTGEDRSSVGGERAKQVESLAPSSELVLEKVLPFLEAVLEEESRGDLLTAGLMALAKVAPRDPNGGTTRAAALFIPRLSHPNQEVAETAAVALGLLGDPDQIPILMSLVHDNASGRKLVGSTEVPYRTRAFAIYGLGRLALTLDDADTSRNIGQHLVALIEGQRFSTRDLKVAAILSLGLLPLPEEPGRPTQELVKLGAEHVVSRRALCGYLLEVLRPDRASAAMHSELVRAHAATSLAHQLRLGPDSLRVLAIEEMTERISRFSKEPEGVKASCAIALGHLMHAADEGADKDGRKALWKAVDKGEQSVPRFALIALGRSAGRPGPEGLSATSVVRKRLIRVLEHGSTTVQPWAALALAVLADELETRNAEPDQAAAKKLLAKAKRCRRPQEIGAYALACGIANVPGTEDVLLPKLTYFSDWEAQGYVAIGLGLVGSRGSLKPVMELVEASRFRPELLWRTSVALALLGQKEVVPTLIKLLDKARGASSQAAIATALGWIGDRHSVEPLLAMAGNPKLTEGARAYGVVALGLICDERLLPWTYDISAWVDYLGTTPTLVGNGTGLLDML